jgi:hypothetical protein
MAEVGVPAHELVAAHVSDFVRCSVTRSNLLPVATASGSDFVWQARIQEQSRVAQLSAIIVDTTPITDHRLLTTDDHGVFNHR